MGNNILKGWIRSKSAFLSHNEKVCLIGSPVMVGFIAILHQLQYSNYALLLPVSHSQVPGDHLSAVKWLLSEYEVAKEGMTKLFFIPIIYWPRKKKEASL